MTAAPEPAAVPSEPVDEGARVVTAAAVGLLAAAIVISAMYARDSGDLDLSTFTTGVLATAGLLGFAALSATVRPGTLRSSVVGWPAAAGSIGLAAMLAVLMDEGSSTTYLCSLVLVGLGLAAAAMTRDSAPAVVVLVGATIFYVQAFGDVFDSVRLGGDVGGSGFKVAGGGVLLYVVAATAIGWLAPRTRVLTATLSGAAGIVALAFILQIIFVSRTFAAFAGFPGPGSMSDRETLLTNVEVSGELGSFDDFQRRIEENPYADDVVVVLVVAAALLLFWCFCAVATGHVAFRVLAVAISVLLVPAATAVLTVQHPTWWSVGVAGIGGLLLARLLLRRTGAPGQ